MSITKWSPPSTFFLKSIGCFAEEMPNEKFVLVLWMFCIVCIDEIVSSSAPLQRHTNNRFLLMEHVHPFAGPVQFHDSSLLIDSNASGEDVRTSFHEASKSYHDAINTLTKKNRYKHKSSPVRRKFLPGYSRPAAATRKKSPPKSVAHQHFPPSSTSPHHHKHRRPSKGNQTGLLTPTPIKPRPANTKHHRHHPSTASKQQHGINSFRKPIRITSSRPTLTNNRRKTNPIRNGTQTNRTNLFHSKVPLKPSSSKDSPVTTADFHSDFNRTLGINPKLSSAAPASKSVSRPTEIVKYSKSSIKSRPHQSKRDPQLAKDNNQSLEIVDEKTNQQDDSDETVVPNDQLSSASKSNNQTNHQQQQQALSNLFSNGRLRECDCSARIQPKIIGGQDAHQGKYPFVAAIFTLVGRGSFCGASIVNERFLLTAAHCVARFAQQPQNYIAVVGRTDLNVSNPPEEVMTRAERIWLNGWSNDVALVRLQQPIRFSRFARPACFGGYSAFGTNGAGVLGAASGHSKFGFDQANFDNAVNVGDVMNQTAKVLIAIGWGYTGWKPRPGSTSSRQQLTPMMTTRLQEVALNEVQCSKEPHLICVAAEGRSPCFGDSGSPLLFSSMGRQFVVGLTSRSSSHLAKYCLGAPTIYERTSYYLPWMRTITQNQFCEVNWFQKMNKCNQSFLRNEVL